MKTVLLTFFIFAVAGCSSVSEPDTGRSGPPHDSERTTAVLPPLNPVRVLHEDLTTLPVAQFRSTPELNAVDSVDAVDAVDELPSADFTTKQVKEDFASSQTRIVYEVRKHGDQQIRHGEYREPSCRSPPWSH